jgi:hypothetical protein
MIRRLIPKFTLEYGTSISQPSLRYAIVLYGRSVLPQIQFSGHHEIAQQSRSTCLALNRRLKRPDVLDEGDLFAAFFLAWHFHMSGYDEELMYAKGFFAIARRLFDAADTNVTDSTFQIFNH